MDFGEAFRVIWRRWRVAVPVLVLTLITVAVAYVGLPTKYQSTAEISLIGSSDMAAQQGNGNNPYVIVAGLDPVASILASDLSSDQVAEQLKTLGVTNGFTATVPDFATGPFVALTVTGHSSSAVRDSMPVVINFAQLRLLQMQQAGSVHIPTTGLIRAVVISPASTPKAVRKSKIELAAGVVIAGLILLLMLSFWAEGRALRRARSRETPGDMRAIELVHPGDEQTLVLDGQEERNR
jgi:uncharacterized protein involved in exopolysaccharide biosynthesis